ncbi:MAG: tRNA lysidine(34) synthetase TilS [Betaproteobacteria bacterium HGW-Betaproteobacteria-11]|nr:MAG: tRNA lysidine(34) synthetase TilS [Betaproteobacteria bacterium HGW-Betaproteobacteria-11]
MADSRNSLPDEPVLRSLSACLARHVRSGPEFTIAYSGGLDSTVLLHAAQRSAAASDAKLSALHIHHGLSPNADAWAGHCARQCASLNIRLDVIHLRIENNKGEGLEGAARVARLQALLGHSSGWILMAHHANDQAETVLHNLLRGAGPRGMAAIPEVRGRVLRPLLHIPGDHLLAYARDHDLKWVDDESNDDRHFTRNYLRHEVLPVFEKRFPGSVDQLAAVARRFAETQDLLDQLALADLGAARFEFPVPLDRFRELPELRARNLMRSLLSHQGVQLPGERRLNEFVRQLRSAGSDRHPCLCLVGYTLRVGAGMLNFSSGHDLL